VNGIGAVAAQTMSLERLDTIMFSRPPRTLNIAWVLQAMSLLDAPRSTLSVPDLKDSASAVRVGA